MTYSADHGPAPTGAVRPGSVRPDSAAHDPESAPQGRRLSELAEQAARCTADACGAVATVTERPDASAPDDRPPAVTHPDLGGVAAVQLRSGEGPIPLALAHGEPVTVSDLLSEERWPRYRAVALDRGVRACVTLPFRRAGLTVTLSLYGFRPRTLAGVAHGPARALGELAATVLVCDRRHRAARAEIEQLGTALRTRPVVDQACGIVMHVLDCTADDAFAVLRRVSQATNRKLADVAAAVVDKRGRGLERELADLGPL